MAVKILKPIMIMLRVLATIGLLEFSTGPITHFLKQQMRENDRGSFFLARASSSSIMSNSTHSFSDLTVASYYSCTERNDGRLDELSISLGFEIRD